MDKLVLVIMLPLWWVLIVTPDFTLVLRYIFERTDPTANVITLGLLLIAARFSELHRTGQLPSLRRRAEDSTEYAVEFDDESEVWGDD